MAVKSTEDSNQTNFCNTIENEQFAKFVEIRTAIMRYWSYDEARDETHYLQVIKYAYVSTITLAFVRVCFIISNDKVHIYEIFKLCIIIKMIETFKCESGQIIDYE